MKLNLIPQPKSVELLGHVLLSTGAVSADPRFQDAADTYEDFRGKLFGEASSGVPVRLVYKEGLPHA